MSDLAMGHARRLIKQKRQNAHTAVLDKRQGRATTTTSVTRVRATDAEVTVTRVRTTATPDAVDDATADTTTARAARPAATTAAPAPVPAPAPASSRVVAPATTSAVVAVASLPATATFPLVGTVSAPASAGTLGEANGTNTTKSGGLSKGATIGVAIAAAIVGLLLIAFLAVTCMRRRKAKAAGQADYSWSSREKEDLYGPSPSRNVMSDASFGNTAPPANMASAYRPLSGDQARSMLLGGAPAKSNKTNQFSEAMFSAPKQPAGGNAPRASFMAGPQGPPPSVGALYGQQKNAQSPFDDSQQYSGKVYVVRRTFEPSLADELIIYPGDRIEIITVYDDGWCLGINLDSAKPGQEPQKGVFPRDCVEEMNQDAPLNQGASGLQRAPTLPPMSFEGNAPAISISGPSHNYKTSAASNGSGSHILSRFPETPARPSEGANVRRTSSLIAGKDAELYKALGDAIDPNGPRR